MMVVLGATGYMGRAFVSHLRHQKIPHATPTRQELDLSNYGAVVEFLRVTKPSFVVNAAGFTGKPNVDACETARAETLLGNAVLPLTLSHACQAVGVSWGHISSGCIYNGAKVIDAQGERIEPDLLTSEMQQRLRKDPESIQGFAEDDEPNFSFRKPPCSFYSGTKALAEEALAGDPLAYIWRLRIPFDEESDPRNYLTKLRTYPKVYDNVNSLSHRGDFVRACLELWERGAPAGVYNVTNPGFITAREVVAMIERILKPGRPFEFWTDDKEFYGQGVKAPRSNCVMNPAKLLATGIELAPVAESVEKALRQWRKAR